MGVQGFLNWILIGSSIHTLGWGGRNWGLQAGCCKGKYNHQLKIDWHFLFSVPLTLRRVHWAHISVLNLSVYGFSEQCSSFLPFSPLLFSHKFSFNTFHKENSISNINSDNCITKIYPQSTFFFQLHLHHCSSNHHLLLPGPTQQPPN